MSEQEEKIERIKSKFVGQTQYLGPNIPHIGLQFGTIFKNGIYPGFAAAIAECPSIGELFVAVGKSAEVQRQPLQCPPGHGEDGVAVHNWPE